MAWEVTSRMNQVSRFVHEWEAGLESRTALCKRYGIVPKTGYALMKRYSLLGEAALVPRPPIARSHPNRTSDEVRELIIPFKHTHPSWGNA